MIFLKIISLLCVAEEHSHSGNNSWFDKNGILF